MAFDPFQFLKDTDSTALLVAVASVSVLVSLYFWKQYWGTSNLIKEVNRIPGPPTIPLFGNALSLLVPDYEVIGVFQRWAQAYGLLFRIWLGNQAYIFVAEPKIAEQVLSSKVHVNKAREYDLLHPFLGNGLSTLNGHAWSSRRRVVSSAFFHFKTMEDFLSVFNEQSFELVEKLLGAEAGMDRPFNIHPYMTQCTLNIICETAMGRIDSNMNDEEYMKTVHEMCEVLIERTLRPWLRPALIWRLSAQGRKEKKMKKILHDFISKVIQQRKAERAAQGSNPDENTSPPEETDSRINDESVQRKRKGFLDLLLDASENGSSLSDVDVRDETQTFIFGGHDTTASSLSWTLFLIATSRDVQEKVGAELVEIFGTDQTRPVTLQDTSRMKYMECCIKEALRLYPSGPFYGRYLHEDLVLEDGRIFPAGATVFIAPIILHRSPKYYAQPNEFRPERFLPDEAANRNPFEYLPFSAGPRSCIGQKFAMMEEKVILANLLRHFHVEPAQRLEDVKYIMELTLKPKDGPLLVIQEKRKFHLK